MKISFSLLIAFLLIGFAASADIVDPGTVSRQFTISNMAKFKGFTFYRLYYRYHYDRGYKAYPPDTLSVELGGVYAAGDRDGTKSALLAKDKAGRWYKSTAVLGGSSQGNPAVSGITDFYEVVSIAKNVIKLKKTKEAITYKDGIKKEFLPATGLASLFDRDSFTRSLLLSSSIAILGMLTYFLWRRRRVQTA
jgi:hypothetical protein